MGTSAYSLGGPPPPLHTFAISPPSISVFSFTFASPGQGESRPVGFLFPPFSPKGHTSSHGHQTQELMGI